MTFTSLSPHDPSDVVGEWEQAGAPGVDAALGRAVRAAGLWRDTPAPARSRALAEAAAAVEQRADEITALIVREVGKPVSEARAEVARGGSILRYYSQQALLPDGETLPAADPDALLMVRHHLVGVAALVTPWNFPVAIPLWKAAPSLAYGNATGVTCRSPLTPARMTKPSATRCAKRWARTLSAGPDIRTAPRR